MSDPEELTAKVNVANTELIRDMLVAALELGNAVSAYFDFYGYTILPNRERLPEPDRVMWDALEKWRGLYR